MRTHRLSFGAFLWNYEKDNKNYISKRCQPAMVLFDASNQVLGRFASEVAQVLRGKHRPDYSPNIYMGDAVIIVNADKIRVTETNLKQKNILDIQDILAVLNMLVSRANEK